MYDRQRKQHFTNDLAKKIGENLKRLAAMDAPSYQDQVLLNFKYILINILGSTFIIT